MIEIDIDKLKLDSIKNELKLFDNRNFPPIFDEKIFKDILEQDYSSIYIIGYLSPVDIIINDNIYLMQVMEVTFDVSVLFSGHRGDSGGKGLVASIEYDTIKTIDISRSD